MIRSLFKPALLAVCLLPAVTRAADDPNLWLEEVTGEKALKWVEDRNATSLKELTGKPEYAPLNDKLLSILNSKARIPAVQKIGDHLYNLWRDEQHSRGLWRRTSLAEYKKAEPKWETVLDLDAVAKTEGENWVWHGADCLQPKGQRCLIALSRGGADADVVREFDTVSKTFLKDGFTLPESKGSATWVDQNTLFVSRDFGEGSLTDSGYPRMVKLWQRGKPLTQATMLYEAKQDDMSVGAGKDFTPGYERELITRAVTFYTNEQYLRGKNGKLIKLDKPDDATATPMRDQILIELRSAWNVGGQTYPQGALIAMNFTRFLKGERKFEILFEPGPRKSLDGYSPTKTALLINELDNVRNRVYELKHVAGKWQRRAVDLPAFGAIGISPIDSVKSDEYLVSLTDFTTPTTLYLGRVGSNEREQLKQLPAFFDAQGVKVAQQEATSKDGTKVPYFLVMREGTKLDGTNPTILYGYGGFEVSLKPSYAANMGASWLTKGGVYVLANIRGGGEFGPSWHQAALKESRQKAYDDFISVAEDLIASKITSPAHLGIMGGSNGGLLVGAVMVQRPDLFKAVVCQVPLLDMLRFNKLLAGASWMGEYGDPDDAKQWDFISKYSPYQNVKAGMKYPRTLFTTSTRDDRVHPGHARKMVARMMEQGHDVLYWENTEGGHGGAANTAQQAKMWALTYTFLLGELK
ncbi:prolyl oligopeptidase family serine peptidase [Chitinivorax sp. B]|uniref:prolyl oligopeptidase family serine peptidase n=1 Tax=Chitinivorax sp. B TaxID=2502235 RepID=UPI0010F4691E|nr:prolyl oligopeptidase family serine peptidase [Chitinivorax sp. B]